MRSHGRLQVTIWRNSEFTSLTPAAQRTYMQLLSQKEVTNCGSLPLMVGKWAKGCTGLTAAMIRADLAVLHAAQFIVVDPGTEEVLIRSFIRNDGIIKQPNMLKNALRVAQQVESERLRKVLADELRKLRRADAATVADDIDPGDIGNPYGTLPEPFPNPSETPRDGETLREPFADPCGVGYGVGKEVTTSSSVESSLSHPANVTSTPTIDVEPDGTIIPAGAERDHPMILIPDDWEPDPLTLAKHPRPDITDQADAFRDHARAVGRRCHGMAGWNAAFSSWLRKNAPPGQGAATTKAQGWVDLAHHFTDQPEQKAIR